MGFKMVKQKKDMQILLDPKDQDWRLKLILAYYSMSLTPAFLLEGCISTLIKARISAGSYEVGNSVTEVAPMFKILRTYAHLFRNESMIDLEESDVAMM